MVRDAVGRHPNVAGARREASPAERVQAARPLFDRLLTSIFQSNNEPEMGRG